MNIKTRLQRYPGIMEEVSVLRAQLDGLLEERYNTKVTAVITGMPGGGQTGDPVFQSVDKILTDYDEKMVKLHERISVLMQEYNSISMALWTLDIQQRKIIEMRCFERLKWKDIGKALHFSRAQCSRLFEKGLEELEEYFQRSNNSGKSTSF